MFRCHPLLTLIEFSYLNLKADPHERIKGGFVFLLAMVFAAVWSEPATKSLAGKVRARRCKEGASASVGALSFWLP